MYIYERPSWPALEWDRARLSSPLGEARYRQGELLGRMQGLGFRLREEAAAQTLTEDVLKTSEIEGERLNAASVRSSVARRLGIDHGGALPVDRHVEGIVEIMLDATRRYREPLTQERLFGWHAALFPTGRSGLRRIAVGRWRTASGAPMQVVSGPVGRETVHYEAPPAACVPREMEQFVEWFNAPLTDDPVVRAALAHFRFVTIHPFADGNGRIARAISDMMLARSEDCGQRFYSMSAQIRRERRTYYRAIERCQKGPIDVSPWVEWFLACLTHAMASAERTLEAVLAKAAFWEAHRDKDFNSRQRKVLGRLLDGFEGKLTSSQWGRLTDCSQDTASRDIALLVKWGILVKAEAGGRSTHYLLQPLPR